MTTGKPGVCPLVRTLVAPKIALGETGVFLGSGEQSPGSSAQSTATERVMSRGRVPAGHVAHW